MTSGLAAMDCGAVNKAASRAGCPLTSRTVERLSGEADKTPSTAGRNTR